jgi:hypothetical protein
MRPVLPLSKFSLANDNKHNKFSDLLFSYTFFVKRDFCYQTFLSESRLEKKLTPLSPFVDYMISIWNKFYYTTIFGH